MQNQKKNLWLIALVGALTIAFAAGCPDDDSGSPSPSPSPSPGSVTKNVKIHEGKKLVKGTKLNYNGNIDEIVVNGNGTWVYLVSNTRAELFAADLTGKFADIATDAKWDTVSLAATGIVGAPAVGKRELTAAVKVRNIVGTKEGALVGRSVDLAAPGADNAANGIGYVKGKTWTAAWINAGTDMLLATATEPVYAGVVVNGANEHPVAFNMKTDNFAVLDERVTLAAPAIFAKIDRTLKTHTTDDFTGIPQIAMVGADAMIVDTTGINKLEGGAANAGDLANAANKVTNRAAGAALLVGTANWGSDAWKQDGGGANVGVKEVVGVGGKLYIALNATGNLTGGYVVFDPTGPTVKKPDETVFNNKAVLGFAVDGTKVYLVMEDGLFLTDISGAKTKKGAKYDAGKALPSDVDAMNETDAFFDGVALPTTGITGAKFAKSGLIVTTATDIHVVMPVENVKKTK